MLTWISSRGAYGLGFPYAGRVDRYWVTCVRGGLPGYWRIDETTRQMRKSRMVVMRLQRAITRMTSAASPMIGISGEAGWRGPRCHAWPPSPAPARQIRSCSCCSRHWLSELRVGLVLRRTSNRTTASSATKNAAATAIQNNIFAASVTSAGQVPEWRRSRRSTLRAARQRDLLRHGKSSLHSGFADTGLLSALGAPSRRTETSANGSSPRDSAAPSKTASKQAVDVQAFACGRPCDQVTALRIKTR